MYMCLDLMISPWVRVGVLSMIGLLVKNIVEGSVTAEHGLYEVLVIHKSP
jgi:hypothetical protein